MSRRTTLPTDHVERNLAPRIMIYNYHQDDPKKCSAARLEKFHLADSLHRLGQIPRSAIVLNPFGNRTLSFEDRSVVQQHGLVGLDCSWNQIERSLQGNIKGENRRIPLLVAGNPTNYSTRGKLSTVEALAAALIITGFSEKAEELLRIFSWGETFLSLNRDPLRAYAETPSEQMFEREREYFPTE